MTESSTDTGLAANASMPPQRDGRGDVRGDSAHSTEWVSTWDRSGTLDALRSLLDVSRRATPALARRAGLTHTEMAVLEHVMENPTGPSELAQRLGVTTAAASGIVDRLAARGHVVREAHLTDRRRTVVGVTSSGREEVLGHLLPMFLELARIDAGLTEDERAVIQRFLKDAERAIQRLL